MKIPQHPPLLKNIWEQIRNNPKRFDRLGEILDMPLDKEKYLHWDELRYRTPPESFSHEEWWFALKMERRRLFKEVPLNNKAGKPFKHLGADPIPEILHQIDQGAGGSIQMPEQIMNPDTKNQYYVNSLIQEAITSGQLEGAATTRKVAKEMLQTGRPPCDTSEQMIVNNFLTMQQIGNFKDKPLSKDMIFQIHKLITKKTLKEPSAAGQFRKPNEKIVVADIYNNVFHDPPDAKQLEERMAAMCDFASGKTPNYFIHPVIRSIILHFWLAYDHPFADGNGRTARALFYWSMLKNGFWLFEFISISQIILKAPVKYGRAFLHTETDENDLTYFILYHLDVIKRAIKELHEYIKRKTRILHAVENQLRGMATLNHRQRALISHALRHQHRMYTIESHRMNHNVVYQTSRMDLMDLEKRGLLERQKVGRTWYFTPITSLEKKLTHSP